MRNVIMRGTVLMLVYGMVLSLGLLYVQVSLTATVCKEKRAFKSKRWAR